MARFTPLHLVPALIAAASHAGELTVETASFQIERSFTATALPTDPQLVRVDPEVWSDFEFVELADHGSRLAAGDALFAFDREGFDRRLADARESAKSRALTLAQTEEDYRHLAETTPHRLEAARRAAARAKDDHDYFVETRRDALEASARQSLRRVAQQLENQREELRQLIKMYEADDLTEETEEIILERQRFAVESGEFALQMEEMNLARTLEVTIPREAESVADSLRDSALALEKAEADLPRALELKELELAAARTAAAREDEQLAKLEADAGHFEITAPEAGWLYYGPIENGSWSVGNELQRAMVPGGKAPIKRPFATFVPASTEIGLVAFLDEATARSLESGAAGLATLTGRDDLSIPAKLVRVSGTPGPDGRYRADLEAEWPDSILIAPGSTAEIRLISYSKDEAITVPTKALSFGGDGWTVEVKLADGKTERRPVRRGRSSGEQTEILSGLEAGQVIVTP